MSLLMVEVLTEKLENLQFTLQNPQNGYEVHDIQGLDPVKAEIVASSFGTVDGSQYQASRRGNRNIVLKLGYSPDFVNTTVASLRSALYAKLMPKASIKMRFYMSDGTVPEILGRVESFDSPLFAQDPEATLSVLCLDSDFINPVEVVFNGFTAPDDPANRLEFTYHGNIDTGIKFTMNVDRAFSELSLRHYGPDNNISTIYIWASLFAGEIWTTYEAGDIIEISTVVGKKGVWRTRGTTKQSILHSSSPESVFFQITPGQNYIQAIVEGAGIPVTISYTTKYGGL